MIFSARRIGVTPLWPAGHLPLKGGDRFTAWPLPFFKDKTPPQPLPTRGRGFAAMRCRRDRGETLPRVFSPLVGEMAGRPEGVFLREATP
ncbi:hypothetical protein F4V90_06130 [Neorhizobium galegae]|nr:hypothetical protein F4V90_06130 [Neorhizobium galegae]